MTTMRVSKFITDATHCGGRIQRALGEQGIAVESIMDNLALVEAHATDASGKDFDVLRLGVEPDNTLVVEIEQRKDRHYWMAQFEIVAAVAALVIGTFLLGMQF